MKIRISSKKKRAIKRILLLFFLLISLILIKEFLKKPNRQKFINRNNSKNNTLKKRNNFKETLIKFLQEEINNYNVTRFKRNKITYKNKELFNDFNSENINITVKSYSFLLEDYIPSKVYEDNHLKKRASEDIVVRGLFQTSIPGIADYTIEKKLFMKLLEEWAPNNLVNYKNITFELSFVNSSKQTTEYEKMVSQQLNGKNSKYDFFMIDSVWTGRYGEHLLDLQGKINSESVSLFNQVNLDSCKYKNKLTALPLYSDYGILLYRKDLLNKYNQPVPQTWDQLEYIAEYIMERESLLGNRDLEGFAGQFKAYEGLTCNIYEWIYSFRNSIDTKIDFFNDESSLRALKKLISLLDKSIISTEALIYDEALSSQRWEKGKVLFMRNWPNSIKSTEESFNITGIKFSFGATKLPGRKNGLSAATLGGWNLGVSRYSNKPLIAAKVVEFLTGWESQKERALKFSVLPTIKSLYYDKEICNVIMCDIYKDIQAINRPSNDENYLDLSEVIYETIHKALENTISADSAIRTIKKYTNVEYVDINFISIKLIIGITVLEQLILLIIFGIIIHYRNLKFIKRSSPLYMYIIIFGLFFQCFTVHSNIGKPDDKICSIRSWVTIISLTIVTMAIYAQVSYFYLI
ncbi:periplasmic binding protein-like II [Neocallimastix californiae]|uniref:Periplasmic binding protein-like II n=1 Tax=Neocallimastix californiae TaxID=1754190 RepID=A0A1Y2CRT1_9FUNG|nr:periplasmic binding protein-like II [Neocallimastix californiae]|eukprot:ORY49721.1 periplasmic binding protein-like II [Neocallimastix californiae]